MPDLLNRYCVLFGTGKTGLQSAGGKGANLDRLAQAGFPVPPGFIILTSAYRAFIDQNHLAPLIEDALDRCCYEDPQSLDQVSQQIRSAFQSGKMPVDIAGSIQSAYQTFEGGPVAVRSSATAEDLPDLSFAGQQDTFLNVVGKVQVLDAVIRCWSSLWTARAIGYRARNNIPQHEVSLAVVVQQMVKSTVSGVLFTANPLTGQLDETVIDAVYGLGEALVSGLVEPDHLVIDSTTGRIKETFLGDKALLTQAAEGGGVESIHAQNAVQPALNDVQIGALVSTGRQIQDTFHAPQDIEWAFSDDRLFILQARPITSLFPIPEVSFDPLLTWASFGSVQGMLGPMTPLGRDVIQQFPLSAAVKRLFALRGTNSGAGIVVEAGERLWLKLTDLLRNPIGFPLMRFFLAYVEPSIHRLLMDLAADPRIGARRGRLKIRTLRSLVRFFGPVIVSMLRTIHAPEKERAAFDAFIKDRLQNTRIPEGANRFERLANFADFFQDKGIGVSVLPDILPRFIPILGPSMGLFNLLVRLSGDELQAMKVMRGVPGNVTTEMDLALWRVAQAIQSDADSSQQFQAQDAETLAAVYLQGALPTAAQAAIFDFLQAYGMRGVAEIDFGQPRWREAPAPVMHTLKSYLEIDPKRAPDVQFALGQQEALDAVNEMARHVNKGLFGPIKTRMVRAAARRVRALIGARESPKFFAIRTMGIARQELLSIGEEFAAAGVVEEASDLVFLSICELRQLASQLPVDWKAIIAERKALFNKEMRRKQVPRVLISDGRALYEGVSTKSTTGEIITGSPVSPGVVEGVVHVVHDPRQTRLSPGEILVCPGTDPAWTPLFLTAAGLITEVGGMMTHGSVVAREYGIPAVVGVHQATLCLASGQRVRVNGNTGEIDILSGSDNEPDVTHGAAVSSQDKHA